MGTALVTGGTGCIGAVAVRDLLVAGVDRVIIATRASQPQRLHLWLGEPLDPRIEFVGLDLSDSGAVERLVLELQPTHIVHLAALQSPDCDRDPGLGMRINVGATQSLLEACEQLPTRPQRFVFASSAAVYGPRSMYASPTVTESAILAPPNRYGVWKVAGEHLCQLFWQRTSIPAVCLRLNTTYGPGRDQGMTSAVTRALKCIAVGEARGTAIPFRMPYRGRENYHYVEDVGAHFAAAAVGNMQGFGAYNIRGTTVEVRDFLATATEVAAKLGVADFTDLGIADDAGENLFVSDLDDVAIRKQIPTAPMTPLSEGIERALRRFRELAAAGQLEVST